jgi:hypothetical protein
MALEAVRPILVCKKTHGKELAVRRLCFFHQIRNWWHADFIAK